MRLAPLTLISCAAVFEIAGSSGAAMLAPFFMKAHGYSITLASVPLFVNGVGRVCSDLMSGILASYFSSGVLIVAATIPRLIQVLKAYSLPKPDAPPAGYRLWPLWFVSLAFYHNRLAGGLFVLGLLVNAVLGL